MARHSKWHNIKHGKMAEDAIKSKIFTKHAKLIATAARRGADPSSNPLLRMAIDNAKAASLPNDNIERAIKKGSGEGKDKVIYEEALYEAFGPGGVALLIEVLTDNRNRAIGNIRTILNKKGGRIGESGAVAWMFKKIGEIILKVKPEQTETAELLAIETGATDVQTEDVEGETFIKITSNPDSFGRIRKELLDKGYHLESSKLTYDASISVKLAEDSKEMDELERLVETLEQEDDVAEVYVNLE